MTRIEQEGSNFNKGEVIMDLFYCKNCNSVAEMIDTKHNYERIQDTDDLNADSKANNLTLSELWYCFECGSYFKAYYSFEKITMLKEEQ